jgi:S-formylglutathione hydrolase FrmB
MALFHANFFSETLGMQSNADVILPDRPKSGERLPVLFLLHGLSDDHTIWQRRTSIERYAQPHNIAVVMPNGHRSFYTDMAQGGRYFSYMADELPTLMQSFFPISDRREDTFVAGLSMGGYGAFKLALNRPKQYAAAASLSGALDMARRTEEAFSDLMKCVYGGPEPLRKEPHNLLKIAERMRRSPALRRSCPLLYQACGTEDFLYQDNLTFRDAAFAAKLPLTYVEGPGTHEWGYWDARIQDVLRWLPLRNKTPEAPPRKVAAKDFLPRAPRKKPAPRSR